jgi:hypothetical protein
MDPSGKMMKSTGFFSWLESETTPTVLLPKQDTSSPIEPGFELRQQKRGDMIASIRYLDTFVKQDGAWYFAERNLLADWI